MSAQPGPSLTFPGTIDGGTLVLIPRINIHAFCATSETEEGIRTAFSDRRMARAHTKLDTGGIPAAIHHYHAHASPGLLIVESPSSREDLLASLASLAEVCQPDTKVIVIGHANDVILYRDLMRRGVSEYLVTPIAPLQLVEAAAGLYHDAKSPPLGRVIAFIGAKGGTGSSTIAHNYAREFARNADIETAIIDLDLAFGSATLHFNIDVSGGILEAIAQPERVDALLLDRLLVNVGEKLSVLGGPGGVDRDMIVEVHAIEAILVAMRASMPAVILDLPGIWAPWVRFSLLHADHIILIAEPELASLRNAKAMIDMLRVARSNDPSPHIVLNRVGMPKRREIATAEFQKAAGAEVMATIPFDSQNFGAALNNGRLLLDLAPRSKSAESIRRLVHAMTGEKNGRTGTRASLVKKILAMGKR